MTSQTAQDNILETSTQESMGLAAKYLQQMKPSSYI